MSNPPYLSSFKAFSLIIPLSLSSSPFFIISHFSLSLLKQFESLCTRKIPNSFKLIHHHHPLFLSLSNSFITIIPHLDHHLSQTHSSPSLRLLF
ncbi:hypothetical protein HanIR_Chr17g0872101 [Helianthus annuus]|nr:hypothetical protein HanIR_Chr17g0872101 [Helianthus annuus]